MRNDREIPLESGEGALADLMPNVSLQEVLNCIAQQIWWRVNDWKELPGEDEYAPYKDAALMAYKMAYNALLPETPEYVEWKKQQAQN